MSADASQHPERIKLSGSDIGFVLSVVLPVVGSMRREVVTGRLCGECRVTIGNIARHSTVAQLCDVVEIDTAPTQHGWRFVRMEKSAGYRSYGVQSASAIDLDAQVAIMRAFAADSIAFEAWSISDMVDVTKAPTAARIVGAVALRPAGYGERDPELERAAVALRVIGDRFGIALHSPELALAAGDELGAARHRRALRAVR